MLNPPGTRQVLQNLTCVTDDEVSCLVLLALGKSSDLDPRPTGLVKDSIEIPVTLLASIVDLSLSGGLFRSHLKSAFVSPPSKHPTFNKERMTNCQPVWNISVLSKVLENLVASHLNSHINSSNTSNRYQSTYRTLHSTKSALLKIHNNILSSVHDDKVKALNMLNLSAAFDTIDGTFLLYRLDHWFRVTRKALGWFESYLTARCQRIKIGHCPSYITYLPFWLALGSALGPVLFALYITSLSSMISGHVIPHHLYADDSQLFVSLHHVTAAALNGLQVCLASVQS